VRELESTSGGGLTTVRGEMASSVSALRNVDVVVGLTFLSASRSQICSSRLDKARRTAGLRAMLSSMRRKPCSWEAALRRERALPSIGISNFGVVMM